MIIQVLPACIAELPLRNFYFNKSCISCELSMGLKQSFYIMLSFFLVHWFLGLTDLNYMYNPHHSSYFAKVIAYMYMYVFNDYILCFIGSICTSFMHYVIIGAHSFYKFIYIKCTFIANGCAVCGYNYINYSSFNDKQIVQLYCTVYVYFLTACTDTTCS